MPVRVKADTTQVDDLFRRMGWTIKNSVPGALRQEARLACVSLAFQTQPFGDNATSQAVGQVAVSRDIYKVYATPGTAYKDISDKGLAGAFWAAVKRSAWSKAQSILSRVGGALSGTPIQNFDGGAQHQHLRNNQGRISGAQKSIMIVRDPSRLKAYVTLEQKKVGYGKGGWAACARALGGTRGIPGWVSRQNSPGRVVENYQAERSSVILTNLVPYASSIITAAGIAEATIIARDRIRRSIQAALRAAHR